MTRRDPTVTLPWMHQGQAHLQATLDRVPDTDLAGPSGLPGWSRAHVVAHLARNAEALSRLAAWARTGIETPMYSGPEQRNAEIESSAQQDPATLRADLAETAETLVADLHRLDAAAWQAPVRTAQGRQIPAAEIPWMRVREVWLHAIDLAAGAAPADLPAGVVDTLLDDVTGVLPSRNGCPVLLVEPTDRDRRWRLGHASDDGAGDTTVVRGSAAELLGWLVGRRDGSALRGGDGAGRSRNLPEVPRWL